LIGPDAPLPILEVDQLRIEIDDRRAVVVPVDGVSLILQEGESLGIIGESGSGKTSLARAVMADLPARAAIAKGKIVFDGQEVDADAPGGTADLYVNGLAMVYQQAASALNPVLTIGEQLREVPIQHFGASKAEAHRQAGNALADVLLTDPQRVLASYPHQLSGGQLQRVVIAMALLSKPKLLVLDEPTTGLDVTVQAEILDLINALRVKNRLTVLYISHDIGAASQICDRLAVMYAGEIVESGRTEDILQMPRHPYTKGLISSLPLLGRSKLDHVLRPIHGTPPSASETIIGCRFAPRCASREVACTPASIPTFVVDQTRRHDVRCRRWAELAQNPLQPERIETTARRTEEVLVAMKGVTKQYRRPGVSWGRRDGSFLASRNIDLTVRHGEVFAVVGESGSGKSTLAKILVGLERVTSGSVTYAGVEIGDVLAARRPIGVRRAIQLIAQNPDDTLNPSFSAGWQVGRALRQLARLAWRAIPQATKALLGSVRLPEAVASQAPQSLSGGQKQRVSIARAIAGNPELIVADEPVSALDVSVQAAVLELLLQMNRERGLSIVLISHDLAVVHHVADRIAVIYRGAIVETGSTRQVFQAPYHPYTEALLSAVPTPEVSERRARIRLRDPMAERDTDSRGCAFAPRCHRRIGAICDDRSPPERRTQDGLIIACHIDLADLALSQQRSLPHLELHTGS
jgi:peptide/nickel transport system ATP-binding protein